MILRAMLVVAYATARASHARQVKGDDPDKKGYPCPPRWGLGMRLTTSPCKKKYCYETSSGGQGPPTAVEPMMIMKYTTISETNITAYIKRFVHLSQVGLLRLISVQYYCLVPVFCLGCTRWCTFVFLTHFCNKSNAAEGDTHDRRHDSDITFCWPPT